MSSRGQILTNHHVVEHCTSIEVRRPGELAVLANVLHEDVPSDLALLKVETVFGERDIAGIRTAPPIRNGEEIAVYGFPLVGLLSSSGNITRGNISALAGLGDDITKLQLTAPIQPGNSGGPLLDLSGRVVDGVVTSKLDEMKSMKDGSFPQNVNFAIKGTVLLNFLEAHGVDYVGAGTMANELDLPTIAEAAKQFTVLIVCDRGQLVDR